MMQALALQASIARIEACYEAAARDRQPGDSFGRHCGEAYGDCLHRALSAPEVRSAPAAALAPLDGDAQLVLRFLIGVAGSKRKYIRWVAADLEVVFAASVWRECFVKSEVLQEKFLELPRDRQEVFVAALTAQRQAGSSVVGGLEEIEAESDTNTAESSAEDEKKDTDKQENEEPAQVADYSQRAEVLVKQQFQDLSSQLRTRGTRILVLGAAGVGKSSLVNACFRGNLARTGVGLSVTSNITHFLPTDDCPVHIYDTKGFEPLGENEDVHEQLVGLLAERTAAAYHYEAGDPRRTTERIHAIWWVVDVRFDPAMKDAVHKIFDGQDVPIFVVVNKCDSAGDDVDRVLDQVRDSCPWAAGVVPVVARPSHGPLKKLCQHCASDDIMVSSKGGYYSCEGCGRQRMPFSRSYGIDMLIQATAEGLPELVVDSFLAAQREWLRGLDTKAGRTILFFAPISACVGASPIPVVGILGVWSVELWMAHRLAMNYEVIVTTKTIAQLYYAVAGLTVG